LTEQQDCKGEREHIKLADGVYITTDRLQSAVDQFAAFWLGVADRFEEARIVFAEYEEIAECYGISVDEP
jgi:hypothetical protein